MNYIKTITLSTVAILAISGCSSDDGDTAVAAQVKTNTTINGAAVDGYLNGATVCLDLNNDGLCTIGTEPATSTAINGSYTLTLTPTEQEAASSSVSLLVYGGIDMDTGEWFGGRLRAPLGSGTVNITPLTSMVQAVVSRGGSVEAAEQQVADALGLAVTQVNADPVSLYASAPEVMTATLTVQRTVEVLAAAAIAAGDTNSEATVMEAIYADLGAAIVTVAADDTAEGMAAIVTRASTTSVNIDTDVAVVAAVIEDDVAATVANNPTALADAALLIDASSEAVSTTVVAAVEAGDTTGLSVDATTAAADAETDLEFLRIENLFETYNVVVSSEQILEIKTALSAEVSVTAIVALDLSASAIGTSAVVTSLQNAYNTAQLNLKKDEIKIYLTTIGAATQSDATLTAIAMLSGFSDTMTEMAFVTLLRTTNDINLGALADALDPVSTVTGSEAEWFDGKEMYAFWFEYDDSIVIGSEKLLLNSGRINFDLSSYDNSTRTWTTVPTDEFDEEYNLNTSTGAWEATSFTAMTYTIQADATIMDVMGNSVKLVSVTDLSGNTLAIDDSVDFNVTFGPGAKRYYTESKDNESYSLEWVPTQWTNTGDTGLEFGTLEAYLASGSTGMYWDEATNIGVSFQTNQGANGNYGAIDSSGNLVTSVAVGVAGNLVINDWTTGAETVVGTWDVGTLPAQTTLTIFTHLDAAHSALVAEEGELYFTVYDGKVFVGSYKPAMSDYSPDNSDSFYNFDAYEDIKAAIEAFTFQTSTQTSDPLVPVATISSTTGWDVIEPMYVDSQGDASLGILDITSVKMAQDDNNLYINLERASLDFPAAGEYYNYWIYFNSGDATFSLENFHDDLGNNYFRIYSGTGYEGGVQVSEQVLVANRTSLGLELVVPKRLGIMNTTAEYTVGIYTHSTENKMWLNNGEQENDTSFTVRINGI